MKTESFEMECRVGCGACCIAPSISTPMLGMPKGKPAGQRCAYLTRDNRCELFGHPQRPSVCVNLGPCREMCGATDQEAMAILERLEMQTKPGLG
jgi:Fe-S-cluster containining protein